MKISKAENDYIDWQLQLAASNLSSIPLYKMKKFKDDFDLLSEYMDIYIQLLPYHKMCGGNRTNTDILRFDDFKVAYDRFTQPTYLDTLAFNKDHQIRIVHTKGLGSEKGFACRYFNYHKGCKYFTGGKQ